MGSFDEIEHQWLLDHVMLDTTMLRRWLKAGDYDRGPFYPTERGAAQGGPLSPVLANCTLNGLERLRARQVPNPRSNQVHLIRYADLCRRRHKSAYAEFRIMPTPVGQPRGLARAQSA
jgi:RNA-directed DNA polymerase